MDASTFGGVEEQIRLLTQLRVLGVVKVEAEFSGSGDSGAIDSVQFFGINDVLLPNSVGETIVSFLKETDEHNGTAWKKVSKRVNQKLSDVITDLCYQALSETGLDWYNNEGGQGTFVMDLRGEPPTFVLEVATNYTQTEDHTFEYTPSDGECCLNTEDAAK